MTGRQETVEDPRTVDPAQEERRQNVQATDFSTERAGLGRGKCWRECMGVEPTQDGSTAPHRF
jgi:hypothetical protein